MACNSDFVTYVVDQCSGAGDITFRKMFGGYCLYCCDKIFALICDDLLFLKPTEAGRKLLKTEDLRPPYPGAKPYFYIAEVDDRDYLTVLIKLLAVNYRSRSPRKRSRQGCNPGLSLQKSEQEDHKETVNIFYRNTQLSLHSWLPRPTICLSSSCNLGQIVLQYDAFRTVKWGILKAYSTAFGLHFGPYCLLVCMKA